MAGTPRPYIHHAWKSRTHSVLLRILEDVHFLRLGYQGDAKVKIYPCLDFTLAFTLVLDSLRAATEAVLFFFTPLIWISRSICPYTYTHQHQKHAYLTHTTRTQSDLQLYTDYN
jgi:hypothetical protein